MRCAVCSIGSSRTSTSWSFERFLRTLLSVSSSSCGAFSSGVWRRVSLHAKNASQICSAWYWSAQKRTGYRNQKSKGITEGDEGEVLFELVLAEPVHNQMNIVHRDSNPCACAGAPRRRGRNPTSPPSKLEEGFDQVPAHTHPHTQEVPCWLAPQPFNSAHTHTCLQLTRPRRFAARSTRRRPKPRLQTRPVQTDRSICVYRRCRNASISGRHHLQWRCPVTGSLHTTCDAHLNDK